MELKAQNSYIKDYYSTKAINSSLLKSLLSYPIKNEVSKLYFEEKNPLKLGSLVEDILGLSAEEFDAKYYIAYNLTDPSDNIKSILNYVYDYINSTKDVFTGKSDEFEEIVLMSADAHNYRTNFKREARLKAILKTGQEYYDMLISSENKIVLDQELMLSATDCYFNLINQGAGKNIHDVCNRDDVLVINQMPIYFKYLDKDCKALLDKVIINIGNENISVLDTVLYPGNMFIIDYKVTSCHPNEIYSNFRRYKYAVQESFYNTAVEMWLHGEGHSPYDFEIEECLGLGSIFTVINALPLKFLVCYAEYGVNQLIGIDEKSSYETKYGAIETTDFARTLGGDDFITIKPLQERKIGWVELFNYIEDDYVSPNLLPDYRTLKL